MSRFIEVELDYTAMATALAIDDALTLARAESLEALQRIERSLQMICAAILDLETNHRTPRILRANPEGTTNARKGSKRPAGFGRLDPPNFRRFFFSPAAMIDGRRTVGWDRMRVGRCAVRCSACNRYLLAE